VRRPLVGGLAVCLLLGATAASARTIRGTEGADNLVGTAQSDIISGRGGNDVIDGRGGADLIAANAGRDDVRGGDGDDRVVVHYDSGPDRVACGRGRDVVTADLTDTVAADCEVLSRMLSRDPYLAFEGQHETQVEPDSFGWGSTIVVGFQSGRLTSGGATNIGWATSTNAGTTWQTGFLGGTTYAADPAGTLDAISDPVVAYDAVHGMWLIATLGRSSSDNEILISRSRTGVAWSAPVVAARTEGRGEGLDKEWLTCDNGRASRFRGRCYLSYLDLETRALVTSSSGDGGLSWSAPVTTAPRTPGAITNGAQPVVRPDGSLLVLYSVFQSNQADGDRIASARSTDGGATFEPPALVSLMHFEDPGAVRAPPLASAEVDASGTVYVAWADCSFRDDCLANDIVLASSPDGVSWRAPVRVPIDDAFSHIDHFVPGLGVDAGGRGALAVAYHTIPEGCSLAFCTGGVHVGVIRSADGGRTWGTAQRLSVSPMPLGWMADTTIGRMLADYISTSWVGGKPVPVFSLASQPAAEGTFRQAIFAGTRVPR
jgi:hypothetical protein